MDSLGINRDCIDSRKNTKLNRQYTTQSCVTNRIVKGKTNDYRNRNKESLVRPIMHIEID